MKLRLIRVLLLRKHSRQLSGLMTNPSDTFSLEKRAFLHHKLDDILHSSASKSGHRTLFLYVTDGIPNFWTSVMLALLQSLAFHQQGKITCCCFFYSSLQSPPLLFLDSENSLILLPNLFSPCPLRRKMTSLLQRLQQPQLPKL